MTISICKTPHIAILKILIVLPKLSRVKGSWRLGRPCHRDLMFSYHPGLSRWVWTALSFSQGRHGAQSRLRDGREPAAHAPTLMLHSSAGQTWPRLTRQTTVVRAWDSMVLSPGISCDLNSLPASSSWTFWDFREERGLQPVCLIQEGKCRELLRKHT